MALAPLTKSKIANPRLFNVFHEHHSALTYWSIRFHCIIAHPLPSRHRQCSDPPNHAPEHAPREMALGQHQPVVPGVLNQPVARLHKPLIRKLSDTRNFDVFSTRASQDQKTKGAVVARNNQRDLTASAQT